MTLVAWMLYALALGTLITAAAAVLDRAARLAGLPRRWVWAGALVLSAGLPLSALRSGTPFDHVQPVQQGVSTEDATLPIGAPPDIGVPGVRGSGGLSLTAVTTRVQGVVDRATALLVSVLVGSSSESSPTLERQIPAWAIGAWPLASLLATALLLVATYRLRRARRGWADTVVGGVRVRVSDRIGPAVFGFRRPEIVLPGWALTLEREALRVVLLHESEHVRARDTVLLACAAGLVIGMIWNPILWFQVRRIREAIEFDCDRRVLSHGVPARAYGDTLLRVATLCGGYRIAAVALAEGPGLLERRLRTLTRSRRSRRPVVVASSFGALLISLLLVMVSCQLDQPSVAVPDDPAYDTPQEAERGVSGEAAPPQPMEGVGRLGVDDVEAIMEPPANRPIGVPVGILMDDTERLWGYAILIRTANGTYIHGVFRGPPRLAEAQSDGTWIFDEGSNPRASGMEYILPDGRSSLVVGDAILIRREDGKLIPGYYRGPPKLLESLSVSLRIVPEGASARVRPIEGLSFEEANG